MTILALDIGERRTGAAFFHDAVGFPIPLDTIECEETEQIVPAVEALAQDRSAEELVVGLPLLPSGDEGAQAKFVLACVEALRSHGWTVHTLDERYTSTKDKHVDGDAHAALQILRTFLDRRAIDK